MHQLPEFVAQTTHTAFSSLVWSIGLILECTLFVALFSRRLAGFAPFFTNFVGFYLIRSALLFVFLNHINADSYSRLYNLLLLLDALVQLGVAVESTSHLTRNQGGWTPRNITIPIVFLFAAALGTYLTTALVPHGDVRIERSVIFFSFYMIFLCGWAIALHESFGAVRNIVQGFAIYGIINIIANIGRTEASFAGHPHRYFAWTYVLAGAYLVVVIYWLGTLKPPARKTLPTPLGTTI